MHCFAHCILKCKNMHLNFPNGKVQHANCVQHVQCWDFITISKWHFHSAAQPLTRAMDIVSDVAWPVVFKSQQFSQLLFLVVGAIFIDTGNRERRQGISGNWNLDLPWGPQLNLSRAYVCAASSVGKVTLEM